MTSGTPYIGSKISLVSKAEIRYEGFLYTIDQNNSTVTLAKVISLGTEDRVPESPVPAREEVFEYIVFRGSDIKDLHVCEGPKPKQHKVEDPAIVHQSAHHSYSHVNNPYYPRNYAPFGGGGPSFGYHPFNFHQNTPGDVSYVRQQTPPSLPRTPTPEPVISRDDRATNKNQKQVSNFQDGNRRIRSNESKYKDDTDHDGYTKENRDIPNNANKVNKDTRDNYKYNDSRDRDTRDNRNRREFSDYNRYNNRNKDRDNRVVRENKDNGDRRDQRNRDSKDFGDRKGSKDNSWNDNGDKRNKEPRDKDNRNVSRDYKEYQYTNRDNRSRYNYAKKENQEENEEQRFTLEGGRGQSRGRGGRGYGGRGSNVRGLSRGGNTRTKFTEDFDFETANAKFNKEEIEKELLRVLKKVKIKDESGESTELKDVIEEKEVDDSAPLPSPDKFYDRSKSFFDSISCEAMVPKTDEEVMTRRQEQALNTETFGSSASRFRPGYRGRGRGRGRWRGRGRGGFYRGRGSYRGNSNRPWVDYEFDYEAAGIKSQHQPIKVSAGKADSLQ